MKKILALLMTVLLVVSMLAACGKKNETDPTQPTGEGSSAEGTNGETETGDSGEGSAATEGADASQPTSDIEVDIDVDTGDEEDNANEGGVIDFDDLLDAAN